MLWRRSLVDFHEWYKSICTPAPPSHFDIIIFVEHLDALDADDADADADAARSRWVGSDAYITLS